jgi:hypothetical protein
MVTVIATVTEKIVVAVATVGPSVNLLITLKSR